MFSLTEIDKLINAQAIIRIIKRPLPVDGFEASDAELAQILRAGPIADDALVTANTQLSSAQNELRAQQQVEREVAAGNPRFTRVLSPSAARQAVQQAQNAVNDAQKNVDDRLAQTQDRQKTIDAKGKITDTLLVPIQFPPKITSDSKSANWEDLYNISYEPGVLFRGSSARKITIELVYIVTGGEFTTDKIAVISKQIKGYFYRDIRNNAPIPLVFMQIYNHMGKEVNATFRLTDCGITHGETLIMDTSSSVFPLLTKITLNAQLVTGIGARGNSKTAQKLDGVADFPKFDWY